MDYKIYLEYLQNPSTGSVTPTITAARGIPNKTTISTPAKILSKIQTPVFKRPKSAQLTCKKADVHRLLSKSQVKRQEKVDELKPWSKQTSPFNSRPNSGKPRCRKIEVIEARIPTASNFIIQDTTSSFVTEQPNFSRYDSVNPDYKGLDYLTPTQKEEKIFATEVPSFLHRMFPTRKIKQRKTKKSSTLNLSFDIPTGNSSSKSKIPMKIEYFNLKRRYYPVKYKLNYVPRHNSPYRHVFLRRKSPANKLKL